MNKKQEKKAQIWVSVIIYTLVAIIALSLILSTGLPILNEMKDRTVFSKTKEIMLELDKHLTDLSKQGEGSQSAVSFEVREGKIFFENGKMIWEIETKNPIVSPRTTSSLGNLIIASNANVIAYEAESEFILQTRIKDAPFTVNISKIGSRENWAAINTNSLINYIDYDGNKMDGVFHFNVNDAQATVSGTGYTVMVPEGNHTNLGKAKVIAHMNTTVAEYDLEFTLESYADFLTVKMKNFEPKQ
jgi:hypothetical protein